MSKNPASKSLGLVSAFAATSFLLAGEARGDTFGAQIHYLTGRTDLDAKELSVPSAISEPGLLEGKNLRFDGRGTLQGGSLRAEMLIDGLRLGLGTSLYGIKDLKVVSDPLTKGAFIRTDAVWGSSNELFVGWELGQGPFYPYFDLRGSLGIAQAQVEIHVPDYGHVGTMPYNLLSFGFGPRLGALLPVGHSTMVDINLYHQIVGGIEQVTFSIGLGFWGKRSPRRVQPRTQGKLAGRVLKSTSLSPLPGQKGSLGQGLHAVGPAINVLQAIANPGAGGDGRRVASLAHTELRKDASVASVGTRRALAVVRRANPGTISRRLAGAADGRRGNGFPASVVVTTTGKTIDQSTFCAGFILGPKIESAHTGAA